MILGCQDLAYCPVLTSTGGFVWFSISYFFFPTYPVMPLLERGWDVFWNYSFHGTSTPVAKLLPFTMEKLSRNGI